MTYEQMMKKCMEEFKAAESMTAHELQARYEKMKEYLNEMENKYANDPSSIKLLVEALAKKIKDELE